MNEKSTWTGIAPSPAVLARLDYEEMATLALLCWSSASNRPVTAADVASLRDRDDLEMGIDEARDIVKRLGLMKVVSVFGMANERPMSVRVGGFQPRTPRSFGGDRRPATGAPERPSSTGRPSFAERSTPAERPARARYNQWANGPGKPTAKHPWLLKQHRVETGLEVTPRTPSYVSEAATRLRTEQVAIEGGNYGDDLVGAAKARLDVLLGRIALYERWLKDEPGHPKLAKILEKKRKAVPEMKFQIERAKAKQVSAGEERRAS